MGKILAITTLVTTSIVAPLSAGENFDAIRRFLESTSPVEAEREQWDKAKPASHTDRTPDIYFVRLERDERVVSELVGRILVNLDGEILGNIENLVIAPTGRVTSIINSHGGFLGFGEHRVAVRWGQILTIGDVVVLKLTPG